MNQIISSDKNNDYIDYTYDSNWPDKISSVSSGSSSINYTYNTDGTLASQTYSDGKKIEYTEYDANKKLLSMTDYFGNTTSYEYDGKNQISSISEQYKNNTDIKTTTYQYNENGTLSTVVLPEYVTRYYTYDYAGRISTLKNETGRVYSYSRHSYTYDNAGNITQETEQLGTNDTVTKSFSYDSLNRVSYETDGGYSNRYSYDSHNNLYSAIGYGDTYYEYDANNRLVSVEDLGTYAETADGTQLDDWYIDYEYDSNGNLLSSNKYSGQGYISNQCEYTYSAWGQLTNYSDSLGQGAEYAYYADGLRSSKKIGSNTIKYYYNGDTVINETKNGSQLATNVNGADGFISRYQSGRDNYFMFNAHGDTTLVFTGWRTGEYHYNAWGKDLSNYNYWSDANPIRYSGEYYDTESGMQYLRGRYYSPELRRFITEDPAKDGLNWYAYCSNNPIMFVDPSGEKYIADDLARWIWRQGAEYYLRNKKGWYLTATLLELSTYEEGQSFSAHNGEYAAELIKNDTSFRKFVNDIIWEEGTSKGEKYVYKATSYEFNLNNGDLGAAIHNADVYITADQLSNGSWSVYVQVHDTFDFTEFVNPLSYDTVKEMFLWTMNDLAYLDQSMNILTPVECWIDFCDIY